MTRVGSAGSTVLGDRVTLGLVSLGMSTMFFEVLRLVPDNLSPFALGIGHLRRNVNVTLYVL